jgi:hypothetical protein
MASASIPTLSATIHHAARRSFALSAAARERGGLGPGWSGGQPPRIPRSLERSLLRFLEIAPSR